MEVSKVGGTQYAQCAEETVLRFESTARGVYRSYKERSARGAGRRSLVFITPFAE
ncbi:hypothetical protein DPMN_007676 [Dreissena polymorpha]|uniref:Uncharacterized protein n=1 Tax=Dreissena polymorpha TaxID=45954 RepID=A0A9D4RYG4_DREPO|nr:hypothetical protein DPMN_007676 [Dreissena polymorpha]